MTEKVYEFWYNECIHESVPITISLHQTKKGAIMTMEAHKAKKLREWIIKDKRQKKEYGKDYKKLKSSPFGANEAWGVEAREVFY